MPVEYLIRDQEGRNPAAFNAVFADAGFRVVRSGVHVQMPRMNSIM